MEDKNQIGYGKRIVVSAAGSKVGGAIYEIEKGKETDMAFHLQSEKIIYVLNGMLKVRVLKEGQVTTLNVKPGISFYVKPGLVHQLEAIENSIVIEFASSSELYADGASTVIKPGSRPEVVPEAVKEGEFAMMSPEDEKKVDTKPKSAKKKRATRKKKPTKGSKTTKRKRK